MSFEIKDFDAGARLGVFHLNNKQMQTPNLFPVVSPFKNLIPPRELYDHFGVQALFTNAYIINRNIEKREEILQKGLHKYLDFPGIIATDSGGFQDYMYGGDLKITPEEIEPFQEKIGSDCPVILDIPVQTTDSYEIAKNKIDITIQRAKENLLRRTRPECAWFGPIHGSVHPDLLKYSTIEMSKLDFGIYAIGGVVKTFIDYRFDLDIEILLQVRQWLNPSKPLHMFGLGLPSFFSLAVACGADTFDSAAYFLYAKDDRYFTLHGTKNIQDLVELPCHCPICTKYTAEEIRKADKTERIKLLSAHNLYLSFSELKTIRQAISEGTLWDLVEQRVNAHPKLIKALKVTQKYPHYFDSMINHSKIKGMKILGENSYYHAEIREAREKMTQYIIPNDIESILILPELDLPGKSNLSMKAWLKYLNENKKKLLLQILIASNLYGAVPLELSEIYPIGQHDGSWELSEISPIRKKLMENLKKLLINSPQIKEVFILKPSSFTNEYNETEPFHSNLHILSNILQEIKQIIPNAKITTIENVEDIINE